MTTKNYRAVTDLTETERLTVLYAVRQLAPLGLDPADVARIYEDHRLGHVLKYFRTADEARDA